jgi:hypothetical protein
MNKWKYFTYFVILTLALSITLDTVLWNFSPSTLVHICALAIIIMKELDDYVEVLRSEVEDEDV